MPEETLNQAEVTEAGPSPVETTTPETTAPATGAVKTETEKVQEESEAVPYERFKQANERAKFADIYEKLLSPYADRIKRNPKTGEYELVFEDGSKKKVESQPGLGEKELSVLTELHPELYPILQKYGEVLTSQIFSNLEEQRESERQYTQQANFWFEKAKTEFGDEINQNNSALRQRANKILYEELAERNPDGSTFIPPKAQYDAFAMAFIRLQREAQGKAKQENSPIKKQSKFVSGGGKGTGTTKMSKEEFAALPQEEQDRLMREEWNSNLVKQGLIE